jgi:hypothetical protein
LEHAVDERSTATQCSDRLHELMNGHSVLQARAIEQLDQPAPARWKKPATPDCWACTVEAHHESNSVVARMDSRFIGIPC